MEWSFSEYLNLIEFRSQTWCQVDLHSSGGFRIPHSEGILFYAVMEGSAWLSWGVDQRTRVKSGDIAIVVSGDAHTVRFHEHGSFPIMDFLADGEYADAPRHFSIGCKGPRAARILCGRLKARWPGAKRPTGLPALFQTSCTEACVDIPKLFRQSQGSGSNSVFTRAAMMIFVAALRAHPRSQAIFRQSGLREPIAQAMQFIETHPFIEWTVERMAAKVGMSRSNFALRFADEVGVTPMNYVAEQRMKHAAEFLRRTDLKIAVIAERIGYRSESAFSHRFFAHFAMTPGEMRNRSRQDRVRAQQSAELA